MLSVVAEAITETVAKLSSERETIAPTADASAFTTPKLLTFTMNVAGMQLTCVTYYGSTEVQCFDS